MSQETEEEEKTYCIKRFYHPSTSRASEVVQEGLTLEEAQEHCQDPSAQTDKYFDGYQAE